MPDLRRVRPEWVLTPLLLVVVLIAWQLAVNARLVSALLLPGPTAVWNALVGLVTAPWFPEHVATTAIETIVGFGVGGTLAIAFAAILHHAPLMRRVFYPYILTFQLTPSIVLAPIFIIIFGLGIESKIFVSLTTSFFVILITSLAGFASVDPDSRDLMRVLVASRWTTFRMLTFPTALPFIFTGLRTGIALALIGALVGEFITARAGLGVLLTQFTFNLRQDMVFATIIVIVAFGLTLYGVVEGAHRWLVWWRPEDR